MKVQVLVRLKNGVLDVQGKAVEQALANMNFSGVDNVRIGKLIEFDVKETDSAKAQAQIDEMCKNLLVNPIIESYEIRR